MSNITTDSMASVSMKDVLQAADKFVQKIVLMACTVMDVEVSVFFWLDPESGCLRVTHSHDREGIGLESTDKASIEWYCADKKLMATVNDPERDPRVTASSVDALTNVLCVPMLLRESVFGVLLVGNKTGVTPPHLPIPFCGRDEDVVQYFGAVAALGFRRYQEYVACPGTAGNMTTLHRMLSYTSQRTLTEAAAAVNLENMDYFLSPSQTLTPPRRPVPKSRLSWPAQHEENGSRKSMSPSKIDGGITRPFLGKNPGGGNSMKSIESFYHQETEEKGIEDCFISSHSFVENGSDKPLLSACSFTMGSSLQSRTAAQLRLITLSGQSSSMESIIGKFGDQYFNLLASTSLTHLMDEAQTIVKEFLNASHSYVCRLSADSGGSLIISSPAGDSALNLLDLPKEVITALEWGVVTEVLPSGHFPVLTAQGRAPSQKLRIPGVKGNSALVVPLRSPQEFDVTDSGENFQSPEMSRLLIITKMDGRFSSFEKDAAELFAKILTESSSHVAYKDSSSDLHVHNKIQMLDNFSHLDKAFSLLIGFDGYFMVASRDLYDVFGSEACRGHYTSWIGAKNEQLIRDISNAIENERGVAREDYLLTTPAASKGGGIAMDYSILPLVESYYGCNCMKCSGGRPFFSRVSKEKTPCMRKLRGGSFVVVTARASSQSMSEFRAFCRAASSNPAGWFDDINAPSRLSEGLKNDALCQVKRTRSRASDVGSSQHLQAHTAKAIFNLRPRSYSDAEVDFREVTSKSPARKVTQSFAEYTVSSPAEDLCTWNLNVLKIKDKSLLLRVVIQTFSLVIDFEEIHVDVKVFHEYVKEVAGLYKQVIFHNFYHAACVTHATFMISRDTKDSVSLPKSLQFGLLLSALVHDVHHPGNTNFFEINSKSALAILYNDQSVLENHHCATAFRLMARPGLNVLGCMNPEDQRDIRKLMVSAIMATDMSKHSDLMEETLVRANHPTSWNSSELTEQIFYAKIILHAADLSNPTRHFPIAFEWAKLIAAEFNEQTKLEAASGLPVLSFMVSPDDMTIVKNELSFSTFVVAPMWRGLVKLFPQLSYLLDKLGDNAEQYSELLEELETKAAKA